MENTFNEFWFVPEAAKLKMAEIVVELENEYRLSTIQACDFVRQVVRAVNAEHITLQPNTTTEVEISLAEVPNVIPNEAVSELVSRIVDMMLDMHTETRH